MNACNNGGEQNMNNEYSQDSLSVIPVEVATTNRGDIAAYYSTTTTLEAEQEATVVAQVRGITRELLVEEGVLVIKNFQNG